MMGTWQLTDMEPCALPEKVASGFSSAFEDLRGATYTPVLYCGIQRVHGTNYMLICKQNLTVADQQQGLVKVILHEPLPTDENQGWKVLTIDSIV